IEIRCGGLRDVREALRARARGPVGEALPVEEDGAAERREHTEECPDERALAAAVRAEERHDLPRGDRDVHVAADREVGKSIIEPARGEHHGERRKVAARSVTKTGAPTNAVATPGGISTAKALRQSVSTASMNPAPSTRESGKTRANGAPARSRA